MTNQMIVHQDMPLADIAGAFVKSGFFTDTRDASQAVVRILAGREFGFGPFKSMTGIHIIQGKPSLGADLMAAAVKRSERYDYRVREMSDKACSIEFFERMDGKRESLGVSTFTADDARKAGTKNMDRYPRNMLFARAMSNGVRWYVPDVFGTAVYTPEELGADVDGDGNVINSTFTVTQPEPQGTNGKLPADAPATPEAWQKWGFMVDKAKAAGVPYPEFEDVTTVTVGELRAAYSKLKTAIEDAAGQQPAA